MPDFGSPFSGLAYEYMLTEEELVRAIRFLVAAEYEAVEMYGKVRDACTDERIKKAIQSIIDEEKVHAGEFLQMIDMLDPGEKKFYDEGRKEVEDNVGKMVSALDSIASDMEKDNPRIALAIDRVSDRLENL